MDLQPSGNTKKELLFIETDKIYFTIKGKNRNAEIQFDDVKRNGFIVKDIPEKSILNAIGGDKVYFFEYENYEIIIEKKNKDVDISFYNESVNIRDKITKNKSGSLSGIINFKGEIGYSDLVIKVDGVRHLDITLEVFPSKIDYRKDYINILNDVNEEMYNLAFDFLKRTYLKGGIGENTSHSLGEYYSILKYIYEKLIKALNIIVNEPHHLLMNDKSIVPFYKIKNVTNETIKWLEKRPDNMINKDGRLIPIKALNVSKRITKDTNENRFLKYMITKIVFKLNELKMKYLKLNRKKDNLFINDLDMMINHIKRYLKSGFLKNVGKYEFKESSSMVFKMALGYKDVYKYYLMLIKGLTLKGELFKLSIKDLPLLYEYWCFIRINHILREKYKLISNNMIKLSNNGIFITLKKGVESRVVYQNPENEERFVVSYNSKMKSRTVGQKPDNVLSIDKVKGKVTYNYIFDAKYKLDRAIEGTSYNTKNKTPGPKEEDINTMHRYRDAIVYENNSKYKNNGKVKNNIFGSFVLFPYNNEKEYSNHNFYKSIESVNIGGIPFLPSSTKLMEKFLDELIRESSYSSFERALGKKGKEYYIKNSCFEDRNVLVGSLKNREQLEVNLKSKFYHTKMSNINLLEHNIKYIALAQSKKNFKQEAGIVYYGKVKKIKQVKRYEIRKLPKYTEEDYYIFEVDKWDKLSQKIEVKGYQVRKIMYTTEYLLFNAETVTDLCIKTKEEFRLWKELYRIEKKVRLINSNKNLSECSKIQGFKFRDKEIYISNDKLKIVLESSVKEFDIKELKECPRSMIKRVMNIINT
ncbi:DUF2357 domain-containing protein [Haloimpatiens sp. FM7330]|uniref:DUF2357 domain-containing protein n=1 Tax=Haloimpatiens sp. FM7330 TaxID=3298610 RepID=UPI00363187EF